MLASGILSGKYSTNSIHRFKDTIRARYNRSPEARIIYNNRVSIVKKIEEFLSDMNKKLDLQVTLPAFCQSLIAHCTNVDCVVLGGTHYNQVLQNLSLPKINPEILEQLPGILSFWQSESL